MKKNLKKIISLIMATAIFSTSLTMATLPATAESYMTNSVEDSAGNSINESLENYQNKADSFNYVQYLGQHYTSSNITNQIYSSMEKDELSSSLVEDLLNNPLFFTAYHAWMISDLASGTVKDLSKKTYYETIILKILQSNLEVDTVIDWMNQKYIKDTMKLTKSLTELADQKNYKYVADNYDLSELNDGEIKELENAVKNYVSVQKYHITGGSVNFVSDILKISKDVEDLVENTASYLFLAEVSDGTVNFLKELRSHSSDNDLTEALDDVIAISEDSFKDLLKKVVVEKLFFSQGKQMLKEVLGKKLKDLLISRLTGGVLSNGSVIVNGVLIGNAIGRTISDIVFSTNSKLDKFELMKSLSVFEDVLKSTVRESIASYDGGDAFALSLSSGIDLLYRTYEYDSDLFIEMIRVSEKDWIAPLYGDQFTEAIENANIVKSYYQEAYDKITLSSGSCGNTVGWIVLDDGSLLIYGTGEMDDYDAEKAPWYVDKEVIKEIYVSTGITRLGNYAFYDLINADNMIVLSSSVECGTNCFDIIGEKAEIVSLNNMQFLGAHKIANDITVLRNLNFLNDSPSNITIEKDITVNVEGDSKINGSRSTKPIDFHVHGILNISGNFNINSVVNLYNYNVIKVCGDFNGIATNFGRDVTNGWIYVYNNASFFVDGDFNLKGESYSNIGNDWMHLCLYGDLTINGNFSAINRFVSFDQYSEESVWIVNGDFYTEALNEDVIYGFDVGSCKGYVCNLNAGKLILNGDYKKGGGVTIMPKNTHTTILSGNKLQSIESFNFKNLVIQNESDEGVLFKEISCCTGGVSSKKSKIINGKNLYLSGGYFMDDIYSGEITLEKNVNIENDINILGNLYCCTTQETHVNVKDGTTINVNGDAEFVTSPVNISVINSSVDINEGANLNVSGDMKVSGSSHPSSNWSFHWLSFYINGKITVGGNFSTGINTNLYEQNSSGYLKVQGDFSQTDSRGELSAGAIELDGNYNGQFTAKGNHTVILKGTTGQTVNGLRTQNIVISNFSDNGITFNNIPSNKLQFTVLCPEGYSKTIDYAVKSDGLEINPNSNEEYITENKNKTVITIEGVADITAPLAEIKIDEYRWSDFIDQISFNRFFNKGTDVTISANDLGSGVNQVCYYLSHEPISKDNITKVEDWIEYKENIKISDDGTWIIYVKVSDNSGNVKYYSSNGIVIDSMAPIISGIKDGNTYCEPQIIAIDEPYLDTITINGALVSAAGNNKVLIPANGEQEIIVSDKAGNSARIFVNIRDGHSGGEATCNSKAVCDVCKSEYGEFNADNHKGTTYAKDQREATCYEEGYTGDTYCSDCHAKIKEGNAIPVSHMLQKVEAKAPAHDENGNIEYYVCTVCGACFSDAAAAQPVTLDEVTIPATGSTPEPDPELEPKPEPGPEPEPEPIPAPTPGDVDGTTGVTAGDRTYLARALAGWDGYEVSPETADLNNDGKVTVADRTYLARALAGWEGYKIG